MNQYTHKVTKFGHTSEESRNQEHERIMMGRGSTRVDSVISDPPIDGWRLANSTTLWNSDNSQRTRHQCYYSRRKRPKASSSWSVSARHAWLSEQLSLVFWYFIFCQSPLPSSVWCIWYFPLIHYSLGIAPKYSVTIKRHREYLRALYIYIKKGVGRGK